MIDITVMQDTFYIRWALKLLTNTNQAWTALPIDSLRSVGGEKVFLCEIHEHRFRGINGIKSELWREVLQTWLVHNKTGKILDLKTLRIIDRPIFNNNSVTYKGNTLYLEETINRGIICVQDFVNESQMITYEEFLYKIGGFTRANLDYKAIYNALHQLDINEEGVDFNNLMGDAWEVLNRNNKLIRILISEDDKSMAIGHQYWNRKFEHDIFERYTATITCTKEIKLKELIFKIFHNIYATNFMLQKMKLSPTTECEHCGETDYIDHFFVNCVRLNDYWKAVIAWIEKEVGLVVENRLQEKLFGIMKGEKQNYKGRKVEIANHVILIAKFSIAKAKYFDNHNVLKIFEEEILKREKYLRL